MFVAIFFAFEWIYWLAIPVVSLAWLVCVYRLLKKATEVTEDVAEIEQFKRAIDQYLAGLEACTNQEVTEFKDELQQVKSVVADAVNTMSNSFNGINSLATVQATLVYSLISNLGETENAVEETQQISFKDFVLEIDKVLNYFIEYILTISKQSMEMVNVIHDVDEHMEKIEKLLTDVQGIADQTNLLALNAAIEAARAGEAGRGFAVVADEVRNLSKSSNTFSEEIRTVVRDSKTNINSAKLMIEEMAAKDMSVAIQSKSQVDEMLGDISKINETVAIKLNEVSSLTQKIELDVGNAVRALQFEDMTRQLIEYMQDNTQHMQAIADEIHISLGIFKTGNEAIWIKELEQGAKRIMDMKKSWQVEEKKVVAQKSMDEGEIELF